MRKLLTTTVLAVLPLTAPAQTTTELLEGTEVLPLAQWRYDDLYAQGWRSQEIWDTEVYGPTGEEIGDVENVIIGPDGKILSLILEVGGMWDIGDTHVSVPWSEAEVASGFKRVTIPGTEENAEDYSPFKTNYLTATTAEAATRVVDDDLATGPRAWKLTDLTNDYVLLGDRQGFGWVDEVIFSREGEIQAVVVRPDIAHRTPGYYAYPFYGWGHGWSPGADHYGLPYGREEALGAERFDYGRLQGGRGATD